MITLDKLGGVESLHRTDFYKIITGAEEVPFGVGTVELHPFRERITDQNMSQVYQIILLLEKRHGAIEGSPSYYQGNIDDAKRAYLRKDLAEFKDAISNILLDIVND
jgi:hypothetical protein